MAAIEELTLKRVCEIGEIPLPKELEKYQDEEVAVTFNVIKSKKRYVLFINGEEFLSKIEKDMLKRDGILTVSVDQVHDNEGNELPCIICERPAIPYSKICNYLRQKLDVKIVAVTGSMGKTTMKDMLDLVCKTTYKTFTNAGNANGHGRIGRHLQMIDNSHEVFIQEVGAAHPGLVEASGAMLEPNAFIFTNINNNHIEFYGTQEEIIKDKASLDKFLRPEGVVFLNKDEKALAEWPFVHKVISYGMTRTDVDYYATDIDNQGISMSFKIHGEGRVISCQLNTSGEHNVRHAVGAFAVGRWLGIEPLVIVEALAKYKSDGIRQNFTQIGGQKMLIDCYNAALESVDVAMGTLESIKGEGAKNYAVVLGDMKELGDLSREVHEKVGHLFGKHKKIKKAFFFGPEISCAAKIAKSYGVKVYHTEDRESLNRLIRKKITTDDIVLFKASHGVMLMQSIDQVYGTSYLLEEKALIKYLCHEIINNDFKMMKIDTYGMELKEYTGNVEKVTTPAGVTHLGKKAFIDKEIKSVSLEKGVINIGKSCFYRCKNLQSVSLPTSLKVIERSAFNNCIALTKVEIPKGTTHIDERAFYKCESLKEIVIPGTVEFIGDEAFKGCKKLAFRCKKGTYAEQYASKNGIKVI